MIPKKRNQDPAEHLDRLGSEIIRVSASNEVEGEAAAASPFLYARVRTRIAAEERERQEGESWFAMLGVVWRAIPAMAMVALLAVVLFLSSGTGTNGLSEDADSDTGVESLVSADNLVLSSDEVLATILNDEIQEASR